MAVYTKLSELDINGLLKSFDLGELKDFQSAEDGIQNTTYFLALVDGRELVLTLFENRSGEELPFYTALTTTLNRAGLPVPCPLQDRSGDSIHRVFNKPVLLFPLIKGHHLDKPSLEELAQMGSTLGKIHRYCLTLPHEHVNPLGVQWMNETLALVESVFSPAERTLVEKQIQTRSELEAKPLPRAIIHADLFRDNVLFRDGVVVGIIDFFDAGTDCLILDIAVTINDWCLNSEGLVDQSMRSEFLRAYERQRKLNELERAHLFEASQIAATCVWLSRSKGQLLAKKGKNQLTKNPDSCKKLLLQHLEQG